MAKRPPKNLTIDDLTDAVTEILTSAALDVAVKSLGRPYAFADAEDVTHDAMVALVAKLISGETVADPEAFLATVVRRRAIDLIRNRIARRKIEDDQELSAVVGVGTVDDPRPLDERVWELAQHLPPRQQLCFTLHVVGKLSVAKIATMLEIEPRTVRSHLNRASTALWRELH